MKIERTSKTYLPNSHLIQAIELLNKAIEEIVEFEKCEAGMEAIKSINKAKKEIILGDFKEIAHNIKEKKPSTILQDEVELLNQVIEKAVISKEKVLLARHEFEFWKRRGDGDKKWALKKMEIKTGVTEEQFFAGLKEYGL